MADLTAPTTRPSPRPMIERRAITIADDHTFTGAIVASGTISRWRRLTALAVAGTALATASVASGATAAPDTVPSPGPAITSDGDTVATVGDPIAVDVRPDLEPIATAPGAVPTDPVALLGADAWHAVGVTGAGVKIGVIDYFDVTSFWDEAVLGPRPVAGVTARCFDQGADCTADFFDGVDEGGEQHGVAVVEVVRRIAPDATVYLGQATTIADYVALIDWFDHQGVRVVNRSLGSRYDGPGDGRSTLGAVAESAVARGMTWINSGGNAGRDRYYRHAVRLTGSNVAFGAAGTDRFLRATGCVALAGVRWANDWDRPPNRRTDYDLYVWESPTGDPAAGTVVARSELRQTAGAPPIEYAGGNRCPAEGRSLYLELRWRGGDVAGDVIEILDYGNGFAAHTQAAYSAAVAVVDSDDAGVVAVGALDPPGSGTIAGYSSQGPTNDGRIAPDVAAPAGFPSSIYRGTFSGTSAAAATVTGAAALLVDAGLAGDAASLGDLVRAATVDRGAPGPDPVYGHGEVRLPPPPPPVDRTPSRYVALPAPTRLLDTRPMSAVGPAGLTGTTSPGELRRLPVADVAGIPAGATAVAVNLVTVRPDRRSYVQALPLWQAALGGYSNVNTDGPAQNRANFAIVPVAADGTIALYSTAAGHLVVDVMGWFEPTTGEVADGRFVGLPSAQRLLDTRAAGGAPIRSGATLAVPSPTGVPLGQVGALVVTVTVVRPTSVGWVQAYPAGRPEVIGTTSTVNTSPGSTAASTAIVPVDAGGVAIHTFFPDGGTGHVVVDAIGYITNATAPPSADGRYVTVAPARAFDSRPSGTGVADASTILVDASSAPGVVVPGDASAVMWNLTIVNATRRGFSSGWAAGEPRPATSVLNWSLPREVRAAAAVTAVGAGRAAFRFDDEGAPAGGTLGHFLADVFGYFT